MRELILCLLIYLAAAPGGLSAQIELHPYLGLLSSEVTIDDGNETDRLLFGLDAHFGRRSLTPLVGLGYRSLAYDRTDGPEEERWTYRVVSLPVGLAYRLLPADLDLNLVPHLALLPTYTWDTTERTTAGYGIGWGLRTGVSLYLDWATLGVQYRLRADGTGAESRSGIWSLVAGVRF